MNFPNLQGFLNLVGFKISREVILYLQGLRDLAGGFRDLAGSFINFAGKIKKTTLFGKRIC